MIGPASLFQGKKRKDTKKILACTFTEVASMVLSFNLCAHLKLLEVLIWFGITLALQHYSGTSIFPEEIVQRVRIEERKMRNVPYISVVVG